LGRETFRLRLYGDRTGTIARANQDQAEAAKGAALIAEVILMACGISVADARQRSCARNGKPDQIVGVRNDATLRVNDFDANRHDLFTIGCDLPDFRNE